MKSCEMVYLCCSHNLGQFTFRKLCRFLMLKNPYGKPALAGSLISQKLSKIFR